MLVVFALSFLGFFCVVIPVALITNEEVVIKERREFNLLPDPQNKQPFAFACCPEPDHILTTDTHGIEWVVCVGCSQAWECVEKAKTPQLSAPRRRYTKQQMLDSIPPMWKITR